MRRITCRSGRVPRRTHHLAAGACAKFPAVMLAMIGTAIFFAASYVMAKRISGQASASTVVAMLSLAVTICSLHLLPTRSGCRPQAPQLLGLLTVAAFATAGHFTMTLAFAAAPGNGDPAGHLPATGLGGQRSGALVFGEGVDLFVVLWRVGHHGVGAVHNLARGCLAQT